MRQLTLIRHAKSSWSDPNLHDFERPLNKRGMRDLPALGQRIAEFGFSPDLIITSSATRALTTAIAVSHALEYPRDQIQEVPEIYESCYETILNVLQNQSDRYRHIMLFGHNPGLEDLGYFLTHEMLEKFPTAGLMHIHLSVTSWSEMAESCGTLTRFDYPKLHL